MSLNSLMVSDESNATSLPPKNIMLAATLSSEIINAHFCLLDT